MPGVGVAVVGTGYWGIHHVRVFASEPRCALRAVYDLDAASAERAQRHAPGARIARAFDEVLSDPTVDAMVIATPAATHADLACLALAAGKHVLIEKPLALDPVDAARVVAAAEASRRVVLVGHLMVFHPALERLKALLTSGSLGQLYYLYATRVNLGRLRRDENALWSFGPHDLSMIDYLLDERPDRVSAEGRCFLQDGVEDVVFVTLKFPSGVLAHVHLSWLDPRKERRLTLVGSRMMAEFDDVATDKLRIYDRGYERPPAFRGFDEYLTLRHGDTHIPHLAMEEPLRVEARHFLDCIEAGAAPRTDLASAVRIVHILDAAQRSLALGGQPVVPDFSGLPTGAAVAPPP